MEEPPQKPETHFFFLLSQLEWNGLDIDRGPPYIRPTCYPAFSGGESVIRLSLGKLLLNHVCASGQTG